MCVVELSLCSYSTTGYLSGPQLQICHEVPKRMKRHMTSNKLHARAVVVRPAAYAPIWSTHDPFHGTAAWRLSHSCSLHSSCSDRGSSTCTVQIHGMYLRCCGGTPRSSRMHCAARKAAIMSSSHFRVRHSRFTRYSGLHIMN